MMKRDFGRTDHKSCWRWDELEFVSYCQNTMNVSERVALADHLDSCNECQERFLLAWESLLSNTASTRIINEYLMSPEWQRQKEELARTYAEAIVRESSSVVDIRKRVRTVSLNGSMNMLKAAAMVLLMLAPLSLTYFFVAKPYYERHEAAATRPIAAEAARSPMELAEHFEAVSARVESDPEDTQALLERAVSFERLQLPEEAQRDYQRYLELESSSPRRAEVEGRLQQLAVYLQPAAPQPTSYDRLDEQIDLYLAALEKGDSAKANGAIASASAIADEMVVRTGERYGRDLVVYYRSIATNVASPLAEARRQLAVVKKSTRYFEYKSTIENLNRLKTKFQSFGSKCDIEQVNVQLSKYLVLSREFQPAYDLIKTNLDQAAQAQHHFALAHFYLNLSIYYNNQSLFQQARETLEASLSSAAALDDVVLKTRISVTLATSYMLENRDDHSFEIAYNAIQPAFKTNDKTRLMVLSQVMGISAFNLKYLKLGEAYTNNFIKLAKSAENPYTLAIANSYMGIMRAEQNDSEGAERFFQQALTTADSIPDKTAQAQAEFYVNGYFARAQMLSGDSMQAAVLYNRALELSKAANIQESMALSQIHQGLAESYLAQGDTKRAKAEMEMATALDTQARTRFERSNNFLSLAYSSRNFQERLRLLSSQ